MIEYIGRKLDLLIRNGKLMSLFLKLFPFETIHIALKNVNCLLKESKELNKKYKKDCQEL